LSLVKQESDLATKETVTEIKQDNIHLGDNVLAQMFKKGDFERIKVIGQFNTGFIIGKL
jgi:hypothetical protein